MKFIIKILLGVLCIVTIAIVKDTVMARTIGINSNIRDRFQNREEITSEQPVQVNTVYAIRLDLLDQLGLIKYGPNISIADQYVGTPMYGLGQPAVSVIRSSDGVIPKNIHWAEQASSNNIDGELAGDGSGGSDHARLVFNRNTDYTALKNDRDAQKQLFVVPNLSGPDSGSSENYLLPAALAIFSAINLSTS